MIRRNVLLTIASGGQKQQTVPVIKNIPKSWLQYRALMEDSTKKTESMSKRIYHFLKRTISIAEVNSRFNPITVPSKAINTDGQVYHESYKELKHEVNKLRKQLEIRHVKLCDKLTCTFAYLFILLLLLTIVVFKKIETSKKEIIKELNRIVNQLKYEEENIKNKSALFGLNRQTLKKLDGEWTQISAESSLSGKRIVCFYFSAHWCPPGREFTPKLKDAYAEFLEESADLEIVFVSWDQTSEDMYKYMKESHGNWLAVLHHSDLAQALKTKFDVQQIPALIVCKSDGSVITTKGKAGVEKDGSKAMKQWLKKL